METSTSMKSSQPSTPLRRGAVRADGYTCMGYQTQYGTRSAKWLSPKAMLRQRFRITARNCKRRAKAEGVPHNLTTEYVESIFPKDGLCPILKTPMVWGDNKGRGDSPSLDRRNPELGYVQGNVGFISNRINFLKGSLSLAEIERLVAHIKGNS